MKNFWEGGEKDEFYEEYCDAQIALSKRKAHKIWARESQIKQLAEYITKNISDVKIGICHGVRTGAEVVWFRKYLKNVKVIGTDIRAPSDNDPNQKYSIEWDFHEVKPGWIENVDFIYSNSLDHSYNPELCLARWMSCLKPKGLCFLHHSKQHYLENCLLREIPTAGDCFSATKKEYMDLFTSRYIIVEEIRSVQRDRSTFVLKNRIESRNE